MGCKNNGKNVGGKNKKEKEKEKEKEEKRSPLSFCFSFCLLFFGSKGFLFVKLGANFFS